jgi:2-oxoglutarate ferredoxin oxidoreductase subunit alpha
VNQARWGIHGDHAIIALTAGSHQALFENTVRAFNLAETFRTPVILLYDELIAHMRERLEIPPEGKIPLVERLMTSVPRDVDYRPYLAREDGRLPMSDFGGAHRYNVTGLYHDMWGFPSTDPSVVRGLLSHLVEKIEGRENELTFTREYETEDAETLLISYGSAARTARQTVYEARDKGVRMGLLELETLWPFPERKIRDAVAGVNETVVVEMNLGQVFEQVRRVARSPERVFLANRIDGRFITPPDIRKVLRIIAGKGVWA